ncbi:DUF3486 family protein [Parathalassolituus penaei]|uniref:DUF3486 family protein n=2 Tax=Gammaproteobacteria TaxID=1236 RepID=A0A9X3ITQ8_9GAMM|nr:DUF3486 family protein [Parathalassolituus penaei]MCY0966144.1 DUF3486 family protein [Parathalassolituus penaei]
MADNITRGRPSKIDQLPEQVKAFLNAALRDPANSQDAIREEVNRQLAEMGIPEEDLLSRSGLNRYATKMAKIGKKMQERQATANAWVAKLGEKPTGDIGKLLIQMTQTMAFDVAEAALDEEDPASLGLIKELALTVQRLEKASMDSLKREKEIRKAFAEEAANAAEKVAAAAGLTREAVNTIKQQILGIA